MKQAHDSRPEPGKNWYRIPDGTKVRHRGDGGDGVIDGLTAIVSGASLNADGRTQYRVQGVGTTQVRLAADTDLLFLTDRDGVVLIGKMAVDYRRYVTERLRGLFQDDRFVV
jgi:hypothetical protein